MLRWFEHKQIYHPRREWVTAPTALRRPCEDVTFTAADGVKLSAWFFSATAGSPRVRQAILVCHGNGGNISHRLELCQTLLQTGVNVLVFDYRGYGHSEGRPDEEGTYRDAQAAYEWLRERGFAPENIITLGESLGGAIAAELALREPVGGLILQSTFTCIPDIGKELFPWLPVRQLVRIKYDTRSKLPRIKVPVLVMHSREDDLIHFGHAERNFAAANEPKLFWETNGDHNYSHELSYELCRQGIEKFLGRAEGA